MKVQNVMTSREIVSALRKICESPKIEDLAGTFE